MSQGERAKAFIKAVEDEVAARGVKDSDDDRKTMGVGVFSWDEG
jgi:hypothetical protein